MGPQSRLVKLTLKDALLFTFLELSFESGFRNPFKRYAWTPIFIRFGTIFSVIQGWAKQG